MMTATVESEPAGVSPDSHKELRFLIIDDDPEFVEFIQMQLTLAGHGGAHPKVAGSLSEATEVLASTPVDLIFVDLGLPDATDLEAVEFCLSNTPGTPLIVLTGQTDNSLADRALALGAQDYLVKGEFDERDLRRSIRHSQARAVSEERLRLAVRDLEDKNQQLEEYTAIASHDLRSPVRTARVIHGRLTQLASLDADPQTAQLGSMLDACLGRLEMMMQGLLDFAQAGEQAEGSQSAVMPFAEVAASVVEDLDVDLQAAGAVIEISSPPGPICNELVLRTVLSNLIRNSVRYRSDRPLDIHIDAELSGVDSITVRVSDNGLGIEPQYRSRVFRMFERLSGEGDGIGLGLTLCHRLLTSVGGHIWIEDGRNDQGVTVGFSLAVHDEW